MCGRNGAAPRGEATALRERTGRAEGEAAIFQKQIQADRDQAVKRVREAEAAREATQKRDGGVDRLRVAGAGSEGVPEPARDVVRGSNPLVLLPMVPGLEPGTSVFLSPVVEHLLGFRHRLLGRCPEARQEGNIMPGAVGVPVPYDGLCRVAVRPRRRDLTGLADSFIRGTFHAALIIFCCMNENQFCGLF